MSHLKSEDALANLLLPLFLLTNRQTHGWKALPYSCCAACTQSTVAYSHPPYLTDTWRAAFNYGRVGEEGNEELSAFHTEMYTLQITNGAP